MRAQWRTQMAHNDADAVCKTVFKTRAKIERKEGNTGEKKKLMHLGFLFTIKQSKQYFLFHLCHL